MPKIEHNELLAFSDLLLTTGGMPVADARLVAGLLVKAELRGYSGHGVIRIPPYLAWITDGTTNIRETPRIEREGKISAAVDGNHYIGQVAAHQAMELAINKAKEHGVGIVCLRRAGHTGRLADYMEMAADAGMIAMAAASVGSGTTTLHGGMQRIIGTNPMGFGIPGRDGRHVILDFATASMSMGELQKKVARKEDIPAGMMLDGHGNPTTDFEAFRGPPRGVFLPFGGYKGSGVALIAEILGGVLTGNGPGRQWWEERGHANNGVFFQVVAVEELQPLDRFLEKVNELIALIKSTVPAPGFEEILLPGERSRNREQQQLKHGVELDERTWNRLARCADSLGVKNMPAPI